MKTPRLLAVDDDRAYLDLLERTLAKEDVCVLTTDDQRGVVSMARTQQPDVVLLDLNMPHVTGYELCEALKCEPLTHQIPVLFLTVQERHPEHLARAFSCGACDYITKPFSRLDVVLRVRRAIARARRRSSPGPEDPVTGLPGRPAARARLHEAWNDASRHGCSVSMIATAVDDLPTQDADGGRAARNALLERFSLLLTSETSAPDFAAHDGDLLQILLPRIGLDSALATASRIADVWRLVETPCYGRMVSATASFGVASLSPAHSGAGASLLVDRATSALRTAQSVGGDRVAAATERASDSSVWIVSKAESTAATPQPSFHRASA